MEFSFWFFIIKLVFGALACFFAILLFSKTRDLAWVFVIIGTVLLYIQIVFDTLYTLNIISKDYFILFGINFFNIISVLIANLPLAAFITAFIIVLVKKK